MRTIDLYNPYHLGDSVFLLILFYNIKEYIENNNIMINYYCNIDYHHQLNEFICSNNIKLLNYNNIGLNVWIGSPNFKYNYYNRDTKISYNEFYIIFFNELLEICDINYKINELLYKDNDLSTRYNNFENKYKNLDYLVINSIPLSGQFVYNENDWNNFCIQLNKKYKIITTKKVDGIFCTLDDNLTIKDIASLSTNIKNIISVNTGVLPGLLNEYTLNNIDVLYYFDINLTYSYPKFIKKDNITDLNFLTTIEEPFLNIPKDNNILLILIILYVIHQMVIIMNLHQ